MRPKSKTLFHFTKNQDNLKSILKNGFWPKYCLEDLRWIQPGVEWFIAFPIACFCDIPLSRIQEHVDFYGSFGLGLTKEWAEVHGLNPIMYLASENNISRSFLELNEHANKLTGENQIAAKETMRYMTAFSKPSSGQMEVAGQSLNKEFHLESEWRFVAKSQGIPAYLRKETYENSSMLEKANRILSSKCSIPVSPEDVRYIFVRLEEDIPEIIEFIKTELSDFPDDELSILVSRVTSLERLAEDV